MTHLARRIHLPLVTVRGNLNARSMKAVFDYRHEVLNDEIDPLGHVNNVAYVDWMQSAAIAHSTALGWSGERYRQMGCGWVVRSHTIEYLQPALVGEEIVVRTWVAWMKKATSLRRYRILRPADSVLLATAETLWAFVDYATGRPVRIPGEVIQVFPPWDGEASPSASPP